MPTRRSFLEVSATSVATLGLVELAAAGDDSAARAPASGGKLKQSVCRWTLPGSLPEVCQRIKGLGFGAIDLLYPEEWPVAQEFGLACSMGYASRRDHFIEDGFNDPEHHEMLIEELRKAIPMAAKAGVPNVIAMFGNRRGRSDADGIYQCAAGLTKIAPIAEQHGVTVCVELLNSKVDHRDYQGDHTSFGVAVMKVVGSARVRLLYDIYHMQIMEGDVIRTIRDNHQWIGHFHTGGVPGRHEIDGTQELNYHAIAAAIAEVGFQGYIAHEFSAKGEPFASLADAARICRV